MSATTRAEAAIRESIAREGAITFRDFMERALYSAPGAYYGSDLERIGPRGDYFTSPEVHPAFGALLARQVEQAWRALGRPDPFDLVEIGVGTGALARDLLSYAHRHAPELHRALRYTLMDSSPAALRRQRGTLAAMGPAAERASAAPVTARALLEGSVEGCFLSNELLDALPVHRVRVVAGELREIRVGLARGRLVEILAPTSDPRLPAYFDRLGFLPPEGCLAEVNLAALDWVRRVAAALRRGAVITVDYGYPAEELYSRRHREGTLLCFYRHTLNEDPFARIGLQDMTTHVDFSSVAAEGATHGLESLGLATQRDFLLALGMGRYLADLPALGLRLRDLEANRAGMLELLKPEGLGRIRVLVQQKGLEGFKPAGLRPEGLHPADLGRDCEAEPPPLLTPSHLRLTAPAPMGELLDEDGMWRELMGEDVEQ